MVQGYQVGNWWKLTPDFSGSYINGSWSQLASLPSGYAPLGYASAVLPDGRVVVEGGEFNGSVKNWTTQGAIYDPVQDSWTTISPPGTSTTWPETGESQSVVLASGTYAGDFMIAEKDLQEVAILDPNALTWTVFQTPTKADEGGKPYNEEGWTLLPGGNLLTADHLISFGSEIYRPPSGGTGNTWTSAGSTIADLTDGACQEMGPAVLRPDGTVLAIGASGTTAIATYNPNTGVVSWSQGQTLPTGLGVADGPAALLPSGNVLVDAAPSSPAKPLLGSCYKVGAKFFEFSGSSYVQVNSPPNSANRHSEDGRMLVLPNGQVFFTDSAVQPAIYQPGGTYQSGWRPTIWSVSAFVLLRGNMNYTISGTQFNGLSQASMYGDDAQMATNYPLVQVTNSRTSRVQYARTHDHSTMAVATGSTPVSTYFDIPKNMQWGPSTLVVIANGIPSASINVSIACALSPDGIFCDGFD